MSFSHASDLIKVETIKKMVDTKYNGGEKMSSWDKLGSLTPLFTTDLKHSA